MTADTTALTVDDWALDIPGSALLRVSGNGTLCWPCGRVIVEYDAGYDTIPADLKGYAARLVGLYQPARAPTRASGASRSQASSRSSAGLIPPRPTSSCRKTS